MDMKHGLLTFENRPTEIGEALAQVWNLQSFEVILQIGLIYYFDHSGYLTNWIVFIFIYPARVC